MLLVYHQHNTIRYYYFIGYEDRPQLTTTTTNTLVGSDTYHISHDKVCTLLYNVILIVYIIYINNKHITCCITSWTIPS